MFQKACNVLKMDASSKDLLQCFKKIFVKKPCKCKQIRSDQISTSVNVPSQLPKLRYDDFIIT